ncbi:hypothetical protein Aperf_G00000019070 [Anoplocephala perfoliata]
MAALVWSPLLFIPYSVVVQSFSNKMILDRGSALYLQNRRPLGEVYDTIGSIRKHSYVIVHENRRFKPKNGDTSEATKLEVNVTAGNVVCYVDEEKLSKKLALEDLLLKMRADEQGVNCEELTAERTKANKVSENLDAARRTRQMLRRQRKSEASSQPPFVQRGRGRGRRRSQRPGPRPSISYTPTYSAPVAWYPIPYQVFPGTPQWWIYPPRGQ